MSGRAKHCLRRHRRRTVDGEPGRTELERRVPTDRHRRRSGDAPRRVGPFRLVEPGPTEYVWTDTGCTVRLRLAHNVWHSVLVTGRGEPQIEPHATFGAGLAYVLGFMEQGAVGARAGARRDGTRSETTAVLDDVEVAVGAVAAAIDDIPDIDAVGDVLLEDE